MNGSSPKDSNPQPFAPLGSAPAPRAPRVLPPLSAPLPLTPAPPGSLRSGSVSGSGGVATRRGAAWKCSCEPPSDQPQEACLPPHERRRCLCGGVSSRHACATAALHARPHAVRLRAHRVSRFCIVQGSVLPFGHAPCVCFNGRENRGRGRPVSTARKPRGKPRGTAMSLHPCYSTASARRERSSAIERVLLQVPRCDGRDVREEA